LFGQVTAHARRYTLRIRSRIIPIVCVLAFAATAYADSNGASSNTPQPPGDWAAPTAPEPTRLSTGLIEDGDQAWVWSGMDTYHDVDLHDQSAHAGGSGSYGVYPFRGVSVDVYGMAGPSIVVANRIRKLGSVEVIVDGKQVALARLTADIPAYDRLICHITGLASGNHVLEVHAKDGWAVIDYIKVDSAASSATPTLGAGPLPEGDYAIFPRHAPTKCVDAAATAEGTIADIYAPAQGRFQVWRVTPLGQNRYRIAPKQAPDQVLTMTGPRYGDGMRVTLYHYVGDPTQQWILVPLSEGFYRLVVSSNTIACLDAFGGATTDGTGLIAYPVKQGDSQVNSNQQWFFQPVR